MIILKKEKEGFSFETVRSTTTNSFLYHIPCIIRKDNSYTVAFCSSIKEAKSFGFKEYKSFGFFINTTAFPGSSTYLNNHYEPLVNRKYKGISFNMNRFLVNNTQSLKKSLLSIGKESPTDTISEGKGYTFGVEMETCSGEIPAFYSQLLNMKSEFDGSIRGDNGEKAWGGEYVTGVLYGDYGFFHLNEITRVLSKYTTVNKTCSVHVHLGNIKFTKENVVFLWILFKAIEKQIFTFVPDSRQNNPYCNKMNDNGKSISVHKNDYVNSIERSYENIVKIISLRNSGPSQSINKKLNHPSGRTCGYNKSTPRYWWINFVPTLFNIHGNGHNTIEIRLHSATTNYIKIRNLILLFMGLVSYAENNKNDIMEGRTNIFYILKKKFPNKGDYLVNYFKERAQFFSKGFYSETIEYREKEVKESKNKKSVI